MNDEVHHTGHHKKELFFEKRVSNYTLIKLLRDGELDKYGITEVANDPSGADRWSIIKLNWSVLN